MYDKIYRDDVLLHAYNRCRTNGGAAAVHGQTFEQIESLGVTAWLGGLAEQLRNRTYRPEAVRRVMIPISRKRNQP